MEKIMKRTGAMLLALCLTISCFTLTAHAAEGTLQFSDPSAAAGEEVSVTAKVLTGGAPIGDTDITVTYDPSMLKFESGTNATGGDGTIKLSSKGDGTSDTASYSLKFTALKDGTTKLQATDSTAYLYSNETLDLTKGDSTVTIQGGTPVTDTEDTDTQDSTPPGSHTVKVDGKDYTINETFTEAAVPKGFVAKDTILDGKPTKAMFQQASGQYMYYLTDSKGKSDYYLYSSEDGSFTPTEVVDVNSEMTIYLMNHKDKEGLPSAYKETSTNIGGKKFTAWNNAADTDYYLVYALSSDGNKGYYQYDALEKTYQRYALPSVEEKDQSSGSFTDKVMGVLQKHLTVIMCVVWGAFLLLLILLIVLGVKLSHRNQELDDLYDEYGIDDDDDRHSSKGNDDDDNQPRVKSNPREQFIGYAEKEPEIYEEFYGDGEDGEEEEEYEDEYVIYDDDYDENDEFDDYEDDDYGGKSAKKAGKKSKKDDDDYSMDFIDL